MKANLPAVQWFAVSAHFDAGVNGHVRAEARDDKSGQDLRAVVTGAIAAARLVSGKDAKLDALVNSLQISGTGKNVELGFAVSPEMLDLITGVSSQGLKQLQDAGRQHAPEAPRDHDRK